MKDLVTILRYRKMYGRAIATGMHARSTIETRGQALGTNIISPIIRSDVKNISKESVKVNDGLKGSTDKH